jgi:hypothetical protein
MQARRRFLAQTLGGLWSVAAGELLGAESGLTPRKPHHAAKAKNVIVLFMEGGPSHIDLFDPKPVLNQHDGQPLPESLQKTVRFAFIKPNARLWASPRVFARHGQSGTEVSDFLPHLATCVDDLAVVRSVYSDQVNHHPGQLMMMCGSPLVGRPSMGAWTLYGLGSESRNLPGFVVLLSGNGTGSASGGTFSNGFLPSAYQGVPFRNAGDPVLHLSNPKGLDRAGQRARLDLIRDLNEMHGREVMDPAVEARIESYELAFRMQASAPELLDVKSETEATREAYGIGKKETRQFGTNCLLARRMVERGVRFVQLIHSGWDDHANLNRNHKRTCEATDQPVAALLRDLKQRGLLDLTLVLWGGEFGRTPLTQHERPRDEDNKGRDHHPYAFSVWMAGGGIRRGVAYGKTDELGLTVAENRVHVHDLHATILHCLGLDHLQLTFRHQGRDFRLTDVAGNVVPGLLG